jgi:hypothetical protein
VLLGGFLFLLALMSKEHALFLWPGLIAIDLWRRRDPGSPHRSLSRRQWFDRVFAPPHVGFGIAAAAFLFLRYLVFGWKRFLNPMGVPVHDLPLAHAGPIEHILTPFRLLWVVVRNLVWPESLCPLWAWPALKPAGQLESDVLAGMAVAALLLVAIIICWRRRVLAGAAVAGLVFTLIMPIQAFPAAAWFYAERWLYLPTVLAAAIVAAAMRHWGRAATVGGLAAAFLLLPQTWQYAGKFADDLTMHREVILRQPDNFHGRRNYAVLLYQSGRYTEAVQASNQVVERFGPVVDAYHVQMLSYLELGDGRRALDALHILEALQRDVIGPPLAEPRRRAEALLAQSRRWPASVPSSAPDFE